VSQIHENFSPVELSALPVLDKVENRHDAHGNESSVLRLRMINTLFELLWREVDTKGGKGLNVHNVCSTLITCWADVS